MAHVGWLAGWLPFLGFHSFMDLSWPQVIMYIPSTDSLTARTAPCLQSSCSIFSFGREEEASAWATCLATG